MELTGRVDAEAAQAAGMDAGKLQALADILHDRYVAPGMLPHMHLLVSRDEQPIMSVHSGIARAKGEPLAEDALYRNASLPKPVTSVAFMMLVGRVTVGLEEPVSKLLPECSQLAVRASGSGRVWLRMWM